MMLAVVCDVIYIQMKCVRLVNNQPVDANHLLCINHFNDTYIMCSFIDCCEANNNNNNLLLVSTWALGFEPTSNRQTNKTIKSIIRKLFQKKKKVSTHFMKWPMTKSTTTQPSSTFQVRIIQNQRNCANLFCGTSKWTNQTKCFGGIELMTRIL